MLKFSDIKALLGPTIVFYIFGVLLGPLFGFQQVLSTEQRCYTYHESDNTFAYCAGAVGLLLGAYVIYHDRKKTKTDTN